MAKNQNPMQSQEAAALLKDTARLKALLTSPETKRLMNLLSRQKGDLRQAAQAAKGGDFTGLSDLLRQVGNTEEGARLMEEVSRRAR